jgi:catechol 2,3-dioxygenase-like lactoylglutathione lyase family enzyme
MPAKLNLLVIRSADIEEAARFYGLLGLRFTSHSHGAGPLHYASEDAGCVFEIYPLGAGEAPTASTRFGFQVESVDQTVELLLSAGASLVSKPKQSPWGYRAVVADRDGHRIELAAPLN